MIRSGSTLLEMLVTLGVMAIVAGMVALALRPNGTSAPPVDPLAAARRAAISTRRPVTIDLVRNGKTFLVTALPDGGVVADAEVRIDRFTGEKSSAP